MLVRETNAVQQLGLADYPGTSWTFRQVVRRSWHGRTEPDLNRYWNWRIAPFSPPRKTGRFSHSSVEVANFATLLVASGAPIFPFARAARELNVGRVKPCVEVHAGRWPDS